MTERKLVVAGSTGVVGTLLVRTADARGIDVVPLVRPSRAAKGNLHPRARAVDFNDPDDLTRALEGRTTVLQLIGTMRKRFKTGDTYETSDIGTTRQLVEAAKRAGLDHFVLLSAVGAGRPFGAYLKAKARAEALVLGRGIPFTVHRPSAFMGGERRVPPGLDWATRRLGMRRYQPIHLEQLVDALLEAAVHRAPLGRVLEGESLWELVRIARERAASSAAAPPEGASPVP